LLEVIDALASALKGVALNGSDEMPLWSWCDEGWTCEHPECIAGRAAIQKLEIREELSIDVIPS